MTLHYPTIFDFRNTVFKVLVVDLTCKIDHQNIEIKNNNPFLDRYQIAKFELIKRIEENPNHYLKENNGRPTLVNSNTKISFSHSKNMMAIQASKNFSPGVDVELMREKIVPISKRFLHENEKFDSSLEALHIIWGAKEAIYKHWSKRALSFIDDIRILPFVKSQNGSIIGKLFPNQTNERQIQLDYHFLDRFCLVYITQVT